MICRGIAWFIWVFVAAAMATDYSDPDYTTESTTMEPVPEVKNVADVGLGALLDASDGAVVTVAAGDTRLVAHMAVLAARSTAFAKIPHHEPDSGDTLIIISDVEGPVLRQMVAYMYTLQVPQLPGMAADLLVAADKYGLPTLKADCEQQVAAHLSVDNAAATALLAIRNSYTSLRQSAIAFIKENVFQVMATQGWADAMQRQPQDLIKVIQLLSQLPAETTTSPTAATTAATTAAPFSWLDRYRRRYLRRRPHGRRTAATATLPTAEPHTATPSYNGVTLPRSNDPFSEKTLRRFPFPRI